MISPLNENILVKVLKNEDEGQGIILPDTHRKEEFGMGEVIAVEEGLTIKTGDKVLFDTLLLTKVKIKDEDIYFIKFSDILGYERPGKETTN